MTKVKKTPMRKCVVTGERTDKKQLLRVVRTPEGEVVYDPTGKKNGRGAYVTKSKEVILKAKKTKVLDKHLECVVEDALYEALLGTLQDE
ncbi:MAG: RNase P modulator RnpM [Candidatus Izemoplasmatales bacterium]